MIFHYQAIDKKHMIKNKKTIPPTFSELHKVATSDSRLAPNNMNERLYQLCGAAPKNAASRLRDGRYSDCETVSLHKQISFAECNKKWIFHQPIFGGKQ